MRVDPARAGNAGSEPDEAELVHLARRIAHWRRRRDQLLDSVIFADPEWDILLDLFAENGAGRNVSMSSLCIAAAVPTTTAVRCINAMVDQKVLARTRDPNDARRVLVKMTEPTRAKMRAWLVQVAQSMSGD